MGIRSKAPLVSNDRPGSQALSCLDSHSLPGRQQLGAPPVPPACGECRDMLCQGTFFNCLLLSINTRESPASQTSRATQRTSLLLAHRLAPRLSAVCVGSRDSLACAKPVHIPGLWTLPAPAPHAETLQRFPKHLYSRSSVLRVPKSSSVLTLLLRTDVAPQILILEP